MDDIREMIGAVPEQDSYTTKKITIRKKKDKFKVLYEEDLSKSFVPDCLKVLAVGSKKLVEVTVPDLEKMSKDLTNHFKNKMYNSTIERKNEVRCAIYQYIFGDARVFYEVVMDEINKTFDIKIDSFFVKGKTRIIHASLKQLKEESPGLIRDSHVKIFDTDIRVKLLTQNAECNKYRGKVTEYPDYSTKQTFGSKFRDKYVKLQNNYIEKMKFFETRGNAWDNDIVIKSLTKDKMKKEIEEAIKVNRKKELESNKKIAEYAEYNREIFLKFKEKADEMIAEYEKKPRLFYNLREKYMDKPKNIPDSSKKEIKKQIIFNVTRQGVHPHVEMIYPEQMFSRIGEFTIRKGYRYNVEKDSHIVKQSINFMLCKGYSDNGEVVFTFFIELDKDLVKIYEANGIWRYMSLKDFKPMKPYFDEDIKLIKTEKY